MLRNTRNSLQLLLEHFTELSTKILPTLGFREYVFLMVCQVIFPGLMLWHSYPSPSSNLPNVSMNGINEDNKERAANRGKRQRISRVKEGMDNLAYNLQTHGVSAVHPRVESRGSLSCEARTRAQTGPTCGSSHALVTMPTLSHRIGRFLQEESRKKKAPGQRGMHSSPGPLQA